jgi:hypothetical protein
LKGKGAVIVEGQTIVEGGVDLQAENTIALVGQGNVTLRGTGAETSYFRGQVYTEGDFTVDKITVLGTFLANSQAPGGSQVTLQDARVVQDPRHLTMTIQTRPPAGAPAAPAGGPAAGGSDPQTLSSGGYEIAPGATYSFSAMTSDGAENIAYVKDGVFHSGDGTVIGEVTGMGPITIAMTDGNTMTVDSSGNPTVTDASGNPASTDLIDPQLLAGAHGSGDITGSLGSSAGTATTSCPRSMPSCASGALTRLPTTSTRA